MIDPQELAKKAQSKFGPAKVLNRPAWKSIVEKIFFKNSPQRSYIEGGITVGVVVTWLFTKNLTLLVIWVAAVLTIAIAGIIYWKNESQRLETEIKKYDQEIKDIQKEIGERKEYFENIKKQLNDTMSKN